MKTKRLSRLVHPASTCLTSRLKAIWHTLLLSSFVLCSLQLARAQTHMLYYDPSGSGGSALGGSGFWYQGAPGNWNPWWNGNNDTSWDGNSSVALQGTNGTVTLDAEVDCGPNTEDASPSLHIHENYTLDLSGYNLNFNDQWNEVGIFTDPGTTFQIVGAANTMRTVLNWQDGGIVEFGNGLALTNSQFGVGVFRGIGRVNNDPSGAAAFAWYAALQGGNCDGVGLLSAAGALVEMSTVNFNDKKSPTLSPGIGSGTGTLVLGQNLQEDDATCVLSFNLGGPNQGVVTNGYSWLKVVGSVTLYPGSFVTANLVNGFIPANTNGFDVITCNNLAIQGGGDLTSLNWQLPQFGGLAWEEAIVSSNAFQSLRLIPVFTKGVVVEITQQPVNVTVLAGESATFSIGTGLFGPAAGAASLNYQWQSNGASITGATSSSYTTPLLSSWANKAEFNCVVTATTGSGSLMATSSVAVVTVVSAQNLATLWLPFNGSLNDQGVSSFAPHAVSADNAYGSGYAGTFAADVANATCGSASLSLTGDGSDIQVANSSDLDFNTGNPFTVSAWVNTTAGGTIWAYSTPNPISAAGGTHCIACFIGTGSLADGEPDGTVVADVFWVGNCYSTRTVNDGNWHQVVITCDSSGNIGMSIDGTPDVVTHNYGYAAANEGANNDAATWIFTVGATLNDYFPNETGTDNPFTGLIDEVAVWPQILTSTQISNVYSNGVDFAPPAPPTLTAAKSGNQLILSWPGSGLKLQQNSTLGNPSGWVDVSGGSTSPVNVNIVSESLFFRLAQQ